ncbi:hypothetical protein C8Q78DRAFT_1058402 [Trametes maxima]|nr:hypothetical protein C8Q78DRAFT_1058402 [Trametes maxima]
MDVLPRGKCDVIVRLGPADVSFATYHTVSMPGHTLFISSFALASSYRPTRSWIAPYWGDDGSCLDVKVDKKHADRRKDRICSLTRYSSSQIAEREPKRPVMNPRPRARGEWPKESNRYTMVSLTHPHIRRVLNTSRLTIVQPVPLCRAGARTSDGARCFFYVSSIAKLRKVCRRTSISCPSGLMDRCTVLCTRHTPTRKVFANPRGPSGDPLLVRFKTTCQGSDNRSYSSRPNQFSLPGYASVAFGRTCSYVKCGVSGVRGQYA